MTLTFILVLMTNIRIHVPVQLPFKISGPTDNVQNLGRHKPPSMTSIILVQMHISWRFSECSSRIAMNTRRAKVKCMKTC